MDHYRHVRPRQRWNRRQIYRLRAMVCIAAAALAIPALFAKAPADAQDRATTEVVAAGQHRPLPRAVASTTAPERATTTVPATTAPAATTPPTVPETTAPPTTQAQVDQVRWVSPSTTSTVPPTTTPPPPPEPTNSESGIASYYEDPNGGCAHKTLPFGTVVHITASNGETATCVVDDRGPYGAGRILDLDTSIFAQLAPLGAGVVSVTATW